jgi:hypothetical protein
MGQLGACTTGVEEMERVSRVAAVAVASSQMKSHGLRQKHRSLHGHPAESQTATVALVYTL